MTLVAVTLCTFRRPQVAETLESIFAQDVPKDISIKIIVADNDDNPSGKGAVHAAAEGAPWPIEYIHAPARNISIARNAALVAARDADWVAFLDDDEVAAPDWLQTIISCAEIKGVDGVFGPSVAQYPGEAPGWMREGGYHSNIPALNGGVVITGHTCNALLRWRGTPWRDQRFDLSRGQTGGEDTAFFLSIHRLGATYEICENAIVREAVAPERLSFSWIARRKFRSGQSFVASAEAGTERLRLAMSACGKAIFCGLAAALTAPVPSRRNFWALRGALHVGVVAGCLNMRQEAQYGLAENPD
ncbi:MAG: glycosyltransferase family 2 protein [Pseudomonadota bacterium]